MIWRVYLALLCASVCAPHSARADDLADLEVVRFQERDGAIIARHDEGPVWALVSGSLRGLRGVVIARQQPSSTRARQISATFPTMRVSGIGREHRTICLRIVSIDGLYEANAIVRVNAEARRSGTARIQLPSNNDRVRSLAPLEIGALARVSESDECDQNASVLPVSWAEDAGRGTLNILVGGSGRPGRPMIRPENSERSYACQALPNERRGQTAFRFACSIRSEECAAKEDFVIYWVAGPSREELFSVSIFDPCNNAG